MHNSLFQHHKMYEYVFSHTQAEEIVGSDLVIESALPASLPWPPPLEEGVSEEIYTEFIATPPQKPADAGESEEKEGEPTEEEKTDEAEGEREAELMAQLTPDEVQAIMDEVFTEMLKDVKDDVASKLREKENAFINRINKIHRVASPAVSTPK